MQRDLDLIRCILLEIEGKTDESHQRIRIDGYADNVVTYHVGLLKKEGLVEALDTGTGGGPGWLVSGLTMNGHDFLEKIKPATGWKKIKQAVTNEMTLQAILEMAIKLGSKFIS